MGRWCARRGCAVAFRGERLRDVYAGHGPDPVPVEQRPVLERDGTVRWAGCVVDVRREGPPVTDRVALPAGHRGEAGLLLMTATSSVRRPDRERLLVAITLAEQVPAGCDAPCAGSPRRREA